MGAPAEGHQHRGPRAQQARQVLVFRVAHGTLEEGHVREREGGGGRAHEFTTKNRTGFPARLTQAGNSKWVDPAMVSTRGSTVTIPPKSPSLAARKRSPSNFRRVHFRTHGSVTIPPAKRAGYPPANGLLTQRSVGLSYALGRGAVDPRPELFNHI